MKHLFSFLFVAFLSTSIFAQTTWKVDPAHSQLTFGVTHLGISEVEGNLDEFDATIVASEEDFSDAKYDLSADVNSINTGVERRDDHLRSPDFFEVEKYPEMRFVSTSSEKVGENKYKVTGDLTFHGVTKPVTLDVWYRGTIENPQSGEIISGFRITGDVKRSDFNLGSKFPEAVISDTVKVEFDGEFKKSK